MKLEWNRTTRRSSNAAGVDVRIPFFGGTSGVEWLDSSKRSPGRYLEPIVDALVAWGYTRSKNVVSAPFDWRRAPSERRPVFAAANIKSNFSAELTDYYTMLRTLIETVFRYNQQQKVIVLAHSMGNPIINYFYQKFVDQVSGGALRICCSNRRRRLEVERPVYSLSHCDQSALARLYANRQTFRVG